MESLTEPVKHAAVDAEQGEEQPAAKRARTTDARDSQHGVAPVKAEFIVHRKPSSAPASAATDDAAESSHRVDSEVGEKKNRKRGQNKARQFHFANDDVKLCQSLTHIPRESAFEAAPCEYAVNAAREGKSINNKWQRGGRGGRRGGRGGRDRNDEREQAEPEAAVEATAEEAKAPAANPKCAFAHNLREYLQHKAKDIDGVCPLFEERGYCATGWKCRWLGSHTKEVDGELFLVVDQDKKKASEERATKLREENIKNSKATIGEAPTQEWEKDLGECGFDDPYGEVVNNVPVGLKIAIRKSQFPLKKSMVFNEWVKKEQQEQKADDRAGYVDPPPKPEEKRKLYIGRETPILAPLTTTGNMPFRRLCVGLGAGLTYSEMAMSSSILQGHKPEWALMRAHVSELPNFGAQICANKVDQAIRTTEAITKLFPTAASGRHGLAFVDLNCGCPIDLIYQAGGGSALLDQQNKLIKMLKGMNYVSGETPITVKIRMGTRDSHPTAQKLINKVIDHGDVQSITLHGRSRQQRYTRSANWEYIAETSALIKSVKAQMDANADTAADKERAEKPNVYFVGNGDCYSHIDYYNAVDNSGVDSVMLARGALIKPWIFEEIQTGQYLDKSATERMDLVRDYCKYGLEVWGADELGVATTRRFLLEWLSFTCRYVPIGILERLPPKINDRPPFWKGRNELETLLGSSDYRDWIKISEMFLGPCPKDFFFTPKHKSSSHDNEAEG